MRTSKNLKPWLGVVVAVIALAGCSKMYYATWEKLGKEKRDLLRDNVAKVQKEQDAAQEQFKDALTRLKEMTGFHGGELEKQYDKLKADYDDSEARAKDVRDRISKIDSIAKRNSSLVESAASSARALDEQAHALEQLMSQFKVANRRSAAATSEPLTSLVPQPA